MSGISFKVVVKDVEENVIEDNPALYALKTAKKKALAVLNDYPEELVLSADTVVVLDNLILGKPKDVTDASNILNSLSNKTHFVATSICVLYQDKIIKDTEITKVTFRKLSNYDIKNYIETKKPFDKAGSYAIQDEGFDFVVNIDGCYDNVVGLPLKLVEKHLSWLKVH